MPTPRIREILFVVIRTHRGESYGAVHDDLAPLFLMQGYPASDHLFLDELSKRREGPEALERLIELCGNINREILMTKVRSWAESDDSRRRFLDVLDNYVRRQGAKTLPSSEAST